MKKQLLVISLGAALALPMLAQAEGGYVGVNAGKAKQRISVDGVGSASDDDTGYKVYGGLAINKNFGFEIGYADLGKIGGSVNDGVTAISASAKAEAAYIAATGTYPINEKFAIFGKAGVTFNRGKYTFTENGVTESESDDNTDL